MVDEDLEPMSFRLVSDTIASKDIWAFAQSKNKKTTDLFRCLLSQLILRR